MPVYEYECSLCHCRFDRKQRFDEEPVAMCPACGARARRVIHSVPVIFKGSGFYCTDNRREGTFGGEVSQKSEKAVSDKSEKKEPAPQAKTEKEPAGKS